MKDLLPPPRKCPQRSHQSPHNSTMPLGRGGQTRKCEDLVRSAGVSAEEDDKEKQSSKSRKNQAPHVIEETVKGDNIVNKDNKDRDPGKRTGVK